MINEIIQENVDEVKGNATENVKKEIVKARYFAFLLYPDSLPENWLELLEDLGVPMAVSPLHDRDVSEIERDTGDIVYKKAHWHVIYIANNNVTANSVRKKLKRKLGDKAVSLVKICDNVVNYYQYLTHESKDAKAKNKTIYSQNDIVHLNNFDIERYTMRSKEEKDDIFNKIVQLIMDYQLVNIVMLHKFILKYPELGVTEHQVLEIGRSYSGLLRLYFDGAYQSRTGEYELPELKK